ncbi:vWA domain-containing protein [Dietzia sp.]|uniref:vWA domain-containing protein n=1 Tax=Dietzia sp. TaxID=1871616 RepID=UPI002FDB53E8
MAATSAGADAADARPVPGGLSGHLVDFVEALRSKGITVGPSEAVDAAAAVLEIDLLDREALREALAATLIRRPTQRSIFDQLFDLWFPASRGYRAAADADDAPIVELPRGEDGKVDPKALEELIVDLLSQDTPESLAQAKALAELMVEQMGRYDSTRGPAFSSYQTLGKLDASSIARRIMDGLLGADPDDPDGSGRIMEKAAAAHRANEKVKGFFQQVTDEVRRRTAEHAGRERIAKMTVGPDSDHVDFLRANDADLQKLRRQVGPLARQLGNRLAARRKRIRRGDIDMRRTMRQSMSTGGVPMELILRKPRKARPELVVLCDVSGSVAGFSHFTLQLVHSLREQFSRVRVFAFVDTVDEVTDYFATGDDLGSAMARMVSEAEIVTYDGHSDYGHAFRGFAERYVHTLSPSGSVLVLGDARNNYRDPALASVELLTERARHVHWLNPEPKEYWGTSDSATAQYGEFVPMHECRNIAQLSAVVSQLLPV